jgi:uncharacterized SAM-binding protein YcdF (DUF218 family)
MPAVSSNLRGTIERKYLPVPIDKAPGVDAIVLLGGGVGAPEPPRIEADLSDASDRVFQALRLYRAGKAPVVIAVGGAATWLGKDIPEADVMSALLEEWGVPRNAIIREQLSLNTYQNAVHTKQLLEKTGLGRILLVTSALHMPRALATFRSAGIDAIPSPADYGVVEKKGLSVSDFIPDADALSGTTLGLKEFLGVFYYRWQGWIE